MALPSDTLSAPDQCQQRQQCVLQAQQPQQPQLQPQQPAEETPLSRRSFQTGATATRPHRVRRCSFPPVSSAGAAAAAGLAATPRIPQPPPARALSPVASAPSFATLPLAQASSPPKPRGQQEQQDTGSSRAWRRHPSFYAAGSCKSSPELCSWGSRAGLDQHARSLSPEQAEAAAATAQHSPGSGKRASSSGSSDSGSGCETDLSHLLALQAAAVEAANLQLLSPVDAAGEPLQPTGWLAAQDDRNRQLQQALQEARAAQHGLQGQCALLHDAVCQLQQEKERLQQHLADLESKFTLLSDSGSHGQSGRPARGDGSGAAAAPAATAAAAAGPGLQQQQQQPHLACLLAQLREAQAEVDALVAAELASQKEALLLQRRQLPQHPGTAGAAAAAVASPGAHEKSAALQAQLAQAHQHQQDLNAELLQLPAAGEGMALLCKIQSIKQQLQACRQQIAEHRSLGQQLAAAAAAADAAPAPVAGCRSVTPPPARVLLLQQDSHGSLLSVVGCSSGPRLNGDTVAAAVDDCLSLSSPLAANEQLQLQLLGDEPHTRRVRFASKLPLLLVSPAAPPAPAHELPAAGSSAAKLPAASLQQPASARRRPAPPPKVAAVQPQSARQRLLKHSHNNPLAATAGPEAAGAGDGHTAPGPACSKAAGSNGSTVNITAVGGSAGAQYPQNNSSLQLPGQELGSLFKTWGPRQQAPQHAVPGCAVLPRPRSCRFRNEGPCPASFEPAAGGPTFSGGSASACRQLSPLLLPERAQVAAAPGSGAGAGRLLLPYERLLVSPVRPASTGVATSSGTGPLTPAVSSTPRGLSLDGSLGLGLAGRDGSISVDRRGCCRVCRLVPAPPPASEQGGGGGFGRSLSRGRVLQRRRSCSCLCMI